MKKQQILFYYTYHSHYTGDYDEIEKLYAK